MGLWEFLRQWRPSRVAVGVTASIFLHLAVVALVLWGGKILPRSRWDVKRGDSLIVELPKLQEPASAGLPSAPPAPPAPPSRPAPPSPPSPPVASPKPPAPAPAAPRPAPPAPEERRVASAPRTPAPAPPAPKAAEPPPSLPKGTDPEPAPVEPPPKAAEPTPSPSSAAPSGAPAAPARPSPEQQVASVPPGGRPQGPAAPDMRTALRRGGGGTGQNRGGIEGEPIPLDSDNPRYNDFLEQVRRRIKEKWGYPCVLKEGTAGRHCEYKTASLDVHFGILKDGRVQFVEVVRNSEYVIYDEYAVNAIKLASPFPPVPAEMMRQVRAGSTGVPISARFMYVLDSSLTNLLR